MSIASRLYRILKSNLKNHRTPKSNSQRWQIPDWDTASDRERSPQQPARDPKIAKYYANLEVEYGSDLATVRAAWKSLLKKYHPDLHSGDPELRATAEALTKGLNHAYRQLEKHLKDR